MVSPIAARTPPAASLGEVESPSSFPPAFDVQRLKRALDGVRIDVESLIPRIHSGATADPATFRIARLELARAKLRALRLAAAVSALRLDAAAACRIAEEAAKVAVELNDMRGRKTTGPRPSSARLDGTPTTAGHRTNAGPEPVVDGLIQTARKVIAIARKATHQGHPEDGAMAELQRRTGIADPAVD
ncbi:MAG: hypothetical protein RBS99_15110, partial [Rhodospirillales bacterium]|nr:hypothetical protein [Rhodospirillales bacterium]